MKAKQFISTVGFAIFAFGNLAFEARDVQSVTSTGSVLMLDASAASAYAELTVIYTYNAVPEPSPLALLALAAGIHLVRRRRTP